MGVEYRIEVTGGGVRLGRKRTDDGSPEEVARLRRLDRTGGTASKGRDSSGRQGRVIRGFSAKSRMNMRWVFSALPWHECGEYLAMVTATYPSDWQAVCPDGKTLKARHLHAFRCRWERRFGPVKGAWAMEFQERGAPHIHMYVGMSDAARAELLRVEDSKTGRFRWDWPWARENWFDIVGSGDAKHLYRGVDVSTCRFGSALENATRVGEYFWRESGKRRQKHVPEEFCDVGRFWGYWRMKPWSQEVELTEREYVEARRPLRLLRDKEAKRKVRRPKGLDGLQVVGVDGIDLGVRLRRWAIEEALESEQTG